jgi:phosphoribosylformimino-5-aminoimidazole carboxamide ribotide isomerase
VEDDEFIRWAAARLGDKLVVSLDARDGMLATHGWTQVSNRAAVDVAADLARTGVRHLLYTDIGRDGTLSGPNLGALRKVAQAAPPLSILASGGISSLDDLTALAQLRVPNIRGVIVGRALYEGRFSVAEAITTLENASR